MNLYRRWAIDYATRIGCVTKEASQMLLTAQIVRKTRLALLSSDWTRLEAALNEARGIELADVGAAELRAAQVCAALPIFLKFDKFDSVIAGRVGQPRYPGGAGVCAGSRTATGSHWTLVHW
jgi:hypothetical protein